jgi:serine/threonine protein phosphatase PrpC
LDGHGEWGHHISGFVQERYAKYLAAEKKLIASGSVSAAFQSAVKKIADELADTRSINTAFSGSTACAVLKIGNLLHLANVGDSRAVIGRRDPATGAVTAVQLTTDHKPDVPAEKARIEAAGGRVCALTDGGIVRVWLKHVDEPGLAMSRSIGDEVSASVGVTCQPENGVYTLGANDEFVCVASDGVWEFLDNQVVVDTIWEKRDSPESAVAALVDAANAKWQQESPEAVDDITAVIVFFH